MVVLLFTCFGFVTISLADKFMIWSLTDSSYEKSRKKTIDKYLL